MRRDLIPFGGGGLSFRRPFESLFRMMDDTISGLGRTAVDVFEDGNYVVVKADLPGFSKDEINLSVENNTLLIQAQSHRGDEAEDKRFYRKERGVSVFREAIVLPEEVDEENASARMENGVLEVRIPRILTSKNAKQIEIQ